MERSKSKSKSSRSSSFSSSSSSRSRNSSSSDRRGGSNSDREERPRFRKKIAKFTLPKDTKIEYKNLPLLQRYTTERGKIVPRRISGITAKEQRDMSLAIKYARYLGLLSVGSSKKK